MARTASLRHLLAGTGLTYEFTNPGSITIRTAQEGGVMRLGPIVIAGEKGTPGVNAMLERLRHGYRPHSVVILADEAYRARYGDRMPWIADMSPSDGAARVYICRDRACERPSTDPKVIDELLGAAHAPL